MQHHTIKRLFEQLADKNLSVSELNKLKDYLNNNPDEVVFKNLTAAWNDYTDETIEPKVKQEILRNIESQINLSHQTDKKRYVPVVMRYAAACIIAACLSCFLLYINLPVVDAGHDLVVQTQKGERTNILLPDSSMIRLNGSSDFSYPSGFHAENRKVSFSGEGYFKIAKNENSTFTIHIDDYQIEVLGTEFNVNSLYDDQITLSLITGKVRITPETSKNQKSYILESGQKGVFNKKTSQFVIEQIDNRDVAWLSNKLIFDGMELTRIFRLLENEYGVTIHHTLSDDISEDKFTAVFDNKGLNEILRVLTRYYNFTYEVSNDDIYINNN